MFVYKICAYHAQIICKPDNPYMDTQESAVL
jgi:hypothetical protein